MTDTVMATATDTAIDTATGTRAAGLVEVLMHPDTLAGDRTEIYRRLRDERPMLQLSATTWLASRYQDVSAIMRHPEGRVQPPGIESPPWLDDGPGKQRLTSNMVQTNDPTHGALRSVVSKLFIAPKAEELRQVAAASAEESVTKIKGAGGSFDAVAELAMEVPKGVLSHLLGMSAKSEEWDALLDAQHDYLMIFSPEPLDAAQKARLDQVVSFYFEYFTGLLENPAATGRTELVETIYQAERDGKLERHQSLSLMHTVLDAGFETSRTSISNTVELLATTPGLMTALRNDPTQLATAAEEILRVQAPVQFFQRFVTGEYTASDGTVLPDGTHVLPIIGAANTDERTFANPLTIDLQRTNAATHMSFGSGAHRCLGAPLARVQLQETIRALVDAFTTLELPQGKGPRYADFMFPSLTSLPTQATA